MINTGDILDYLFNKLQSFEEEQFELSVDRDEILSDVVGGVVRFCLDFDITGNKEYYAVWANQDEANTTYPVFAEEIFRVVGFDDTPYGKAAKKYVEGETTAIGELTLRYSKDKEFAYIVKSFHNAYPASEFLMDISKHLGAMQARLSSTEERAKIFLSTADMADVRWTFCDLNLHFKYCEGDDEAVGVISLKYQEAMDALAYNHLRRKGIDKERSREEAKNTRQDVLEDVLEKPKEKREIVFSFDKGKVINIIRTLNDWIIKRCNTYLKLFYRHASAEDEIRSLTQLSFETGDNIRTDTIVWPAAPFLSEHEKSLLDKYDTLTLLAITNLRNDAKKLKNNEQDYRICCLDHLACERKEICAMFKLDTQEAKAKLQRLHRWIDKEKINLRKRVLLKNKI